ncbi:DUF6159 family protein [Lentisphaerota bacterium ZTH]|nr:hypothetical protein JYG24_05590 [Lentisphaerota bacterium]WET07024.1 DUF6159 family protein [Lentisphaerota bacterium ZTH]
MGRFERSWAMFKGAFKVLWLNKKLLLVQAVSMLGMLGVAAFFFMYLVLNPSSFPAGKYSVDSSWKVASDGKDVLKSVKIIFNDHEGKSHKNKLIQSSMLFAFYLMAMFAATFMNVIFFSEIIQALNGNSVSVMRGFRCACRRIPSILMWSLFAGIIGFLIKKLEDNFGFVGRLVINFIGLSWSVASLFAIPVIIREKGFVNPLDNVKKAAGTIRKTWGEGLIGYIGISWLGWATVILSTVLFASVFCILYLNKASLALFAGLAIAWLLLQCAFAYTVYIVGRVYICSLYIYATEGVIPCHFDEKLLQTAWKVKKQT